MAYCTLTLGSLDPHSSRTILLFFLLISCFCQVEDARAALLIYLLHRKEWEQSLKSSVAVSQAQTPTVDVQL